MKQKLLIFPILFVMLLSTAYAYNQYSQWLLDSNIGFDTNSASTFSWAAWASNKPALATSLNASDYSICTMNAGTQEPVIFYDTNSKLNYILVTNNADIYVYTLDCSLLQIIALPGPAVDMPQMAYIGYSQSNTIIYATKNKGIYGFNINTSTGLFSMSYNFSSNSFNQDINHISCNGFFGYGSNCLLFQEFKKDVIKLDLSVNPFAYSKQSSLTEESGNLTPQHPYPISPINPDTIGQVIYRLPFCSERYFEKTGTASFKCDILDETGAKIYTSSARFNPIGNEYKPTNDYAFIAKLGSSFRLFRSYSFEDVGGSQKYGVAIIDDVNSNINYLTLNTSASLLGNARKVSNWVVGDYNQDGLNEACIMIDTSATTQEIRCYNGAFQLIMNASTTRKVNSLVMADFLPQINLLAFSTYEGIFYYNTSTGNITNWYDTGRYGLSDGFSIISGYTAPFMLYSGNGETFMLKQSIESACGNQKCDIGENEFSCPADCLGVFGLPPGAYTNIATECASGYIEYGKCALRNPGQACAVNAQCRSNSCLNGKCTDTDIAEKVNAAKDSMFGTSAAAGNLISMVIILGGILGLAFTLKSAFLCILYGIISIIGLTLMGWLSPLVLIGMFMLGLLVLVLGVTIGKGGGG